MNSETRKPLNGQYRCGGIVVQIRWLQGLIFLQRNCFEDIIQTFEACFDFVVMPMNPETESDSCRGNDDGNPSPFCKLLKNNNRQNAQTHDQAGPVNRQLTLPARLDRSILNPMPRHPQFG